MAITFVVGNIFENVGVRTGFPYGHYHFTDVMGPKLMNVPVMLGLAYVGMAYLSWTLARVILGNMHAPLIGNRVLALPLIAASIMVAWDLSQDPVWATILHCWIWLHGGAYFGVPVTNFLGWYLAVYVIYQSFALYLRGRTLNVKRPSVGYWRQALLFYAVSAAGNLLLIVPRPEPSVVSDPTGKQWNVSDITVPALWSPSSPWAHSYFSRGYAWPAKPSPSNRTFSASLLETTEHHHVRVTESRSRNRQPLPVF